MTDVIDRPAVASPAAALRELNSLMSHQGWLWGKDVRCPEGNRLIAYGFERVPAPDGLVDCTTRYQLVTSSRTILLWSWGYTVYRPEWAQAIHVSRGGSGIHGMTLADFEAPCWSYDDVKKRWQEPNPVVATHITDVLAWPGEYERWIQRLIGPDQREAELREWKNARRPAALLPVDWDHLAHTWLFDVGERELASNVRHAGH